MIHFTENKIFHDSHHGSIKGLSTFSACAEVQDRIFMSNDRGNYGGILLVDQQSAYNVISHTILAEKLRRYKFSEKTVSWFETYLNNRKNKVAIQAKISEELEVGDKGAPEGSVLGGLLFAIYSNDLPANKKW